MPSKKKEKAKYLVKGDVVGNNADLMTKEEILEYIAEGEIIPPIKFYEVKEVGIVDVEIKWR